jgi:DNA-binding response OmpR family regulator
MRVLLIEDNPGDARLLQMYIKESGGGEFQVEVVDRLSKAKLALDKASPDVILLDLSLPDTHGLESFAKARNLFPQLPIIVLTGLDDKNVALQAVQAGAQDYLVKSQTEGDIIVRSIRYAVERRRMMTRLEDALDFRRKLQDGTGVCPSCKQLLKDPDFWKGIEDYLAQHLAAAKAAGVHPLCFEEELRIKSKEFEKCRQ